MAMSLSRFSKKRRVIHVVIVDAHHSFQNCPLIAERRVNQITFMAAIYCRINGSN
jgi:hypothetical protein